MAAKDRTSNGLLHPPPAASLSPQTPSYPREAPSASLSRSKSSNNMLLQQQYHPQHRPANVGILAMDVYFPRTYVSQAKLEQVDGCPGKYTNGLGQVNLAFVDDREDITSIMMTVVKSLLTKCSIDPNSVGRLEVGTETLIDKSKSVKTSLMGLFGENTDIEGITSINACYGGSAALFNSLAWIESSAWDGRYAIVVCGDIAVYESGPARATSGCGAVAMLIGPDAPLVIEPARATHAMDIYDFYKPKGSSEYPVVDGKLSQRAYLQSVDACYEGLKRKWPKYQGKAGGEELQLDSLDYFCFHSPYHKLPMKGLSRLVYNDFLHSSPTRTQYQDIQHLRGVDIDASYDNRELDAVFRVKSHPLYISKLIPTANLNREIGNCYSASIFISLASLVHDVGTTLINKKVFMFSYGSGSMASSYIIRGRMPHESGWYNLSKMSSCLNLKHRLADRIGCSPAQFLHAMHLREIKYGCKEYVPSGSIDLLAPGTYYLTKVDAAYRRQYAMK